MAKLDENRFKTVCSMKSFHFSKSSTLSREKKHTHTQSSLHEHTERIPTYSMKANRKFGEKSSCAIEFCARSNPPQRTISNRERERRERKREFANEANAQRRSLEPNEEVWLPCSMNKTFREALNANRRIERGIWRVNFGLTVRL